ncbi:exosortase A system-associated hydrolase 1 [Sphingomonas gellani]|uniref:Exosortase A system-associated hydrolase 1 n=1 Tax=Sphingomonas gellani TaxID=1166340 RepID=A0A1H7YAQ2_9SPHN|nr:hydrolase 1, exosortase A system-associated [Sphingomonas gellani]SEM43073.1 exosortase A system-associated hydrolase 1 [Sphingomonas gellani]
MRRPVTFDCGGDRLVGSLDPAVGPTGLLIVSGGNEVRWGTHRGMAMLAARLAARGIAVFRFDRRGVGDSEGTNQGWASSRPDMEVALATFRREQPQMTRVLALGNCDAATALACFGASLPLGGLILTNPWTGDDADGLPPQAAIRARYRQRLTDPMMWKRAVTGRLDFRRLFRGLRKLFHTRAQDVPTRMATGLQAFAGPVTVILAREDATAIGFRACWTQHAFSALRDRVHWLEVATSSHSFQHAPDTAALEAAVYEALG